MPAATVAYEHPTLRIATCDNLEIACWFEVPTVPQLRQESQVRVALRTAHPYGTALLNAILGGRPAFSSEVRAEVARLQGELDPSDIGTAHLVTVGGIVGTTVRTFLSTALLLRRQQVPAKVFSEIEAAAQWLAPRLAIPGGPVWDAGRITAAFHEVAGPR